MVLHGPRGAGRSRLARGIADGLRSEGRRVAEVSGSDGTAVPLAPFAPLLLEAGVRPGDDPALSAYTRLPPYLASETASIVVVDDAHLLDTGSGVLVSHLSRAGVPLVLVTEAPSALPPPLRDRTDTFGWVQRKMPPAAPDEILAMATELLGGELTAAAGAHLLACSDGRPAVAAALLGSGLQPRMTPGGLAIDRPFPITAEVRRWSIDPATWTPEVRRAAEVAAVSERLPACAAALPGMDTALSVGLIAEDAGALRFARELDRVVVLDAMPSALWRLRAAQAHDLLSASGEDWSARATLLAVRAGHRVAVDPTLAAAQDPLLTDAERREMLEAVPGDHPAGLVLRGASASADDQVLDAERHLGAAQAALTSAPPTPERDAWLLRVGQELGLLHAVRRGDAARAVVEVTTVAAALHDPDAQELLHAELVKWRLMAGAGGEVSAPLTDVSDVDAARAVGKAVIGAMIASMDGGRAAAHAEVDAGLAALATTRIAPAHAASLLELSRFLALVFDADLTAAQELATARRDAAARSADPELGMWEYAAAELAFHTGRLDDAAMLAHRAARHLAWRDFTGLRDTADALVAAVAVRRGRGRPADGTTDGTAEADVKVGLHRARAHADRHRDVAALAAVAHRALGEMHGHLGILALDDAWMLTRSSTLAGELIAHADRGGIAALLAHRIEAHESGSAQALERAAEQLEGTGLVGRAADAWELSARAHREAGRHQSADRSLRRGVLLRSAYGLGTWPTGAVVLSPRESEIAHLAARRVRSREIGQQLGLSVRTVDNHLARVYRKLGVSGRDELAALLTT